MKYTDVAVTFAEFPNEVSLCINISGCKFHCKGCHSPELWEDVGYELTPDILLELIDSNDGITCIGFMGGTFEDVKDMAKWCKAALPELKIGWYFGGFISLDEDVSAFDYIKEGPYIEERGPLNNPNTNQKMYKIEDNKWIDITSKFWNDINRK